MTKELSSEQQFMKALLERIGFWEEVDGKYIMGLEVDAEIVDPLDAFAVWYVDFNDYYWAGKQVSYNEFRRLLEPYTRTPATYEIPEDDLLMFVDSMCFKIIDLCDSPHYVPDILLQRRLDKWKHYNNLLKEGGGDHFLEEIEKILEDKVLTKRICK